MIPLLLTIAALATPHADAVNAHWHGYAQGSPNVRYLSLEAVPEAEQANWHKALMFSVSSASRDVTLAEHLPKRLDGTLTYYIDLGALKWDAADWLKCLEKYPYSADKNPLVVRGDWLIAEMADPRNSQALYLLLYGSKNTPKTDSDFIKFWGADEADKGVSRFGWVETNSQVNLQRTRFVERFVGRDGFSIWRTMDAFFVEDGKDPLETLDGTFKHDGRELIAQFPKVLGKATQQIDGAAQAYLLANGQGAIAQEAPVALVEDYNQTLGQRAIVNHSSCVVCHDAGMKFPTENGLVAYIRAGVDLKVYDLRRKSDIEAFHFRDVARHIRRDNENYQEFVRACNGLTTVENSKNYKHVLTEYLKPLTLADAAREIYCTPEDLKLAVGYAASNQIEIQSRLAGLAHGRTIGRKQWEDDYLRAKAMVDVWKAGNPTPALMAEAAQQQAPDKLRFRLIVTCPAEAVVYIGKRAMASGRTRRRFEAEVKPDWSAKITVTAVLGEQRESKEIECKAGETVEIAMLNSTSKGET